MIDATKTMTTDEVRLELAHMYERAVCDIDENYAGIEWGYDDTDRTNEAYSENFWQSCMDTFGLDFTHDYEFLMDEAENNHERIISKLGK